jgi:nicotinate dehydrogenase subunit B
MTRRRDEELEREIAEHEASRLLHWFDLDRRGFVKLLGGGLVVFAHPGRTFAQESGRARGERDLPAEIEAWLRFEPDETVTVYTGKVEMGQNIRTSLAQQVAEELKCPFEAINVVMGDTGRVPYDMGTFGSRTTPVMGRRLRAVAATAREQILDYTAESWGTPRSALVADRGWITEKPGNRKSTFFDVMARRKFSKEVPADAGLLPAEKWTVAGRTVPKVNGREFVTGRHVYTSDFIRGGMFHGKVLRPPAFGATLETLDGAEAEKLLGVKVVRDGDFAGLVALDLPTAERAISLLKAKWSMPRESPPEELFESLKKNESTQERSEPRVTGSVEDGLASAAVKVSRTYTVEYIAHAPLETRAAVADWKEGFLNVLTGTQRPFGVREELAEVFHIPQERVRVQVLDTGSAYGGKHTGDAAVEAARLSKAIGRPVRVVWTREEEFTWAYFRPAGVIEVSAGAGRDGTIAAWEFHNFNSGPAAIATPYTVANQKIQFHPSKSPLRQGSYRGLAATANHFARESHMDDLARGVGMDPLAFRLKNIADPRLKAVFEAAAERFGWRKGKAARGRGHGIAGGIEKGGYVATCVEVEVDPASRRVRIVRVVEAFECGAIVNPDGLRNQVEGAIVQGIGGALFEKVRFENGRILNPKFSSYRVPRMSDAPPIEVVLLDRKDLPSTGAGETPIVGIAPAVANAIFAACGVRLRSLPLLPEGIVKEEKNA